MQADTIVGIAGAVLLVAVMIGVFAYEYNNVEDAPEVPEYLTDAQNRTAFEAAFVGLNATDDIDGDTIPNYLDDDIDGDGQNNTVDEDVVATFVFANQNVPGGTPAAAGTWTSTSIPVGMNATLVTVTGTYSTTSPAPLSSQTEAMTIAMGAGSGNILSGSSSFGSAGSTSASYTGSGTNPAAGAYQVTASHNSPASTLSLTVVVTYIS